MRSRSEREIARRLSERGEVEPPADLLARIQAEIPQQPLTLQAANAEEARPRRFPMPQGWLIAASLVAMIGAGLVSLHVFEGKRELTAAGALAAPPSARSAVAPQPPTAPAGPAGPPSRQLEEHPTTSAAPAAGSPPQAKPEPPVTTPGHPGEAAGGVVGGSPDRPQVAPTVEEPAAPPPSPSPAPSKPLARAGSSVSAPQDKVTEPDRREDAANVEKAAPRAKAMTLKKEMQTSLAEGGFIDAATSPRDEVGPPAEASSPERARSAAESRRFSTRQQLDTPAGLAGGAKADAPLKAEGAPSPFANGERRRLLLFRRPEGTDSGNAEVEVNPKVVARYRRVSVTGATLLYEVELQPGEQDAGAAPVVTLLGGARLRIADLSPSWEQATPGFRLAFLAAKLAELEKIPRSSRPRADLAELLKDSQALAAELPGDRRATELLGGVERLSP